MATGRSDHADAEQQQHHAAAQHQPNSITPPPSPTMTPPVTGDSLRPETLAELAKRSGGTLMPLTDFNQLPGAALDRVGDPTD
jgi:hypothetical protein